MLNIPWPLRLTLILGSLVYLVIILVLLRRKKLNVQYSIIWLASAAALILFAAFPYLVAVIGTWFKIEMPVNLVFTLLFIFVLLLLLSLSIIVTGFATRIKQMAQAHALLEERLRRLEREQAAKQPVQPAADAAEMGQAPPAEAGQQAED